MKLILASVTSGETGAVTVKTWPETNVYGDPVILTEPTEPEALNTIDPNDAPLSAMVKVVDAVAAIPDDEIHAAVEIITGVDDW